MITSAEEFVRLRESDKQEEYYRTAHEAATDDVWLEVIMNYPHMRRWVAHNKTVPRRILKILSTDPDSRVRIKVAERRVAGEEILMKLSLDPDESIRLTVAFNPKVTKDILMKLLDDKWERIREVAAKRLAEMEGN